MVDSDRLGDPRWHAQAKKAAEAAERAEAKAGAGPALSKAKEKGRAIACLNQTKQIGMAIALYEGEEDESLPIAFLSSDWRTTYDDLICTENLPYEPSYEISPCQITRDV